MFFDIELCTKSDSDSSVDKVVQARDERERRLKRPSSEFRWQGDLLPSWRVQLFLDSA